MLEITRYGKKPIEVDKEKLCYFIGYSIIVI